jgi:hypothetical protein
MTPATYIALATTGSRPHLAPFVRMKSMKTYTIRSARKSKRGR